MDDALDRLRSAIERMTKLEEGLPDSKWNVGQFTYLTRKGPASRHVVLDVADEDVAELSEMLSLVRQYLPQLLLAAKGAIDGLGEAPLRAFLSAIDQEAR